MIDNGLGLERIAAVLQGVHSNYDIDLFVSLEKEAANVLGVTDLSSEVFTCYRRPHPFMLILNR